MPTEKTIMQIIITSKIIFLFFKFVTYECKNNSYKSTQ